MKNTKKLLSLLLVFVMSVTMTNSYVAKAATSITVTLRVEQDEATLIPPVKVTLTDTDKKDYGIGLGTETLTPLHALAKYFTEKKGATDETMKNYIKTSESQYGLFVEGISADGKSSGSPSAGTQDGTSWMYSVNNTSPSVGMSSYELKDSESITVYGLWGGGIWPDNVETNYSYFDQNQYSVKENAPLPIRLKGLDFDENYNSIVKEIPDASVVATAYTDETSIATEKNAEITAKTDDKGVASLTFKTAGKYVLSAYRKADDGIHYNISRPYAIVTVSSDRPNVSQKAPAKPSSVKAVIKKSKKAKKTVALTWKKVKAANGYRVYLSNKKTKGFKKLADTKKASLTFNKKKGTYYVMVKAYTKADNKRIYSKASKTLKIKVK